MKVALLSRSITSRDAIGTDLTHMARILNRRHRCAVYADHLEDCRLERLDEPALVALAADPGNLIIYHHSLYWPDVENILMRAKAHVVVRYHNITPGKFFSATSPPLARDCRNGREQTLRLRQQPSFRWMGDSRYNLEDAGVADMEGTAVVPPFNNIEDWASMSPEPVLLRRLIDSQKVNLLFVGRSAPNKGLDFLLEIVADYHTGFDDDLALHVVGKREPMTSSYDDMLGRLVTNLKIESLVNWAGVVDDESLLAYFLGCDFYINSSQHEGFCVPLVEAQSLCLPVINRRAGSQSGTLGEDQLLLDEDPTEYSAAIHHLSRHGQDRDRGFLRRAGLTNYRSRFSNRVIEEKFRLAVEAWTGESL
jgi:glycosyltransferase involved in cell wall biosynthesis